MSGRGDDAFWRNEEASRYAEQESKNKRLRREVEDLEKRFLGEGWWPNGNIFEPKKLPTMSGPVPMEDRKVLTPCDPVNHPRHYKQFGVEVIDIIRHVLGPEGFSAYCIGNELKYRLRAGDKGDAAQDIAKAMKYREFREGKCGQ